MPKPATSKRLKAAQMHTGEGFSRWYLLSAAGLAAMFLALSIQKIWNVDIWWQLSTGQWIVEHRAIPRVDQFSYTAADHPWIELRWVFCVLAYLGWQLGGAPLLILAQSAIMAAVFFLITFNTRPAIKTVPGMAILGLGVFAFASRYVVRPELVTSLMVALFLIILNGAARGRMKKLQWLLPVLQVVWVNSHTLFVMGPVIAWFFAGGYIAQRLVSAALGWPVEGIGQKSDVRNQTGVAWRLCGVALLVTVACIANPYGFQGALFPITLWREIHKGSFLGNVIEEFKSPLSIEALTPDIHVSGILALVAGATFLWNWRRMDFARLALWAAHVYLACVAVRNVGLLAVIATWIALANIADVLASPKPQISARRAAAIVRGAPVAHIILALVFSWLTWFVACDRYGIRYGAQATGLGVNPGITPARAALFLADCPELQPRVFHEMADGSYLTLVGGDRFKVFVDPRLEVYGEDLIKAALTVTPESFPALCDQYGINIVLVNSKRMNELGRWLRKSRDWAPVFLDERNIVFVRNIPHHAEFIKAYRLDLSRPWKADRAEPDESPRGWRKWIGGVARPWHSLGMARGLALLGLIDSAERNLRRALTVNPDHGETRLMLAMIEKSRGNVRESEALLAGLPLTALDRQWADRLFAQAFQDQVVQLREQGRLAQVIPILEQACKSSPYDGELLSALALGYLESGNFTGAAMAYRVLAQSRPQIVEYWVNLGRALEGMSDHPGAAKAYHSALAIDPANDAAKQGWSRVDH